MKLENILTKFLPSSFTPKAVESLANNIEFLGKLGAGLLAIFYVVGLIIFGLYHSALHIRSIELLQIRYLYVGFYYFVFLLLHLILPFWWIKRTWQRLVYLFILLCFVIFLSRVNNLYISYLTSKWFFGVSSLEFQRYGDVLINGISLLAAQFLLGLFMALSATIFYKKENLRYPFILSLLTAIVFNYNIFVRNIFPFIPDAIGGGQPPIVNIVFADNVPRVVTSNFDIVGIVPDYSSDYYLGRLIYMDDNSVFLKEPFWYSNEVYEIQRKDIIMLNYKEFNPAELGQHLMLP